FSDKADKENFIVVYPSGTGPLEDRLLTWNAGNCCGYALDNKIDDVGFLRMVIEKMKKDYNVDSKHIYATGLSNGAMMSYRLACELSDKIAAIAPVAGALNLECAPFQPVSMIIFHGTADQHVLYEGGKPKKKADPHPRTDNSVAYAVSFWVDHNKCATKPQHIEKGNIVMDTYSGGRNGSEVVLYTIKGGGHAWPGGKKYLPWADDPTQEISATDLMWEFFLRHPKQ
ncbi:MAG: polyhydroxybutyrate depolymerase, partial [Acidobacteriota bacterium]